jgi:FkbM family methyltransferase
MNNFEGDLVLDVDVRENTGISLWHFPDLYEKESREAFCAAIRPGVTVLDVGANIGLYTLLGAKRGARVYAVEADPVNAAVLRHHVEINGFSERVTVFEMAATDSQQTIPLFRNPLNLGESNICSHGEPSGTVSGRTLDSLNLPPIDVCKIDIEGAELMALVGMQGTLARSPDLTLLVEYAEQHGSGEPLVSFLRSHFTSLKALDAAKPVATGDIPPFCNILATRPKMP